MIYFATLIKSILIFQFLLIVKCDARNEKRINKDINDFNDVDMERLYEQWEENEEPLEPDELPEHLRPSPKINLQNLNNDPEDLLKLTKKGKTLMMFVSVNKGFDKATVDRLTGLWQTSFLNNHLVSERFLLDDNRAIYMFKDGSQAWEAKDYLIEQKEVNEVTIESKPYLGKYSDQLVEKKKNDEL